MQPRKSILGTHLNFVDIGIKIVKFTVSFSTTQKATVLATEKVIYILYEPFAFLIVWLNSERTTSTLFHLIFIKK